MNNFRIVYSILLTFGIHFFTNAQTETTPKVELIEEKKSKRWLLYAQNNTEQEQEAFLMVQGEGFRRSADRPVIKKIPPHSKILMITLIPLKGVTPTYTKVFTYETNLQTISKRKGENRKEYVNIRPIKDQEFTVFIDKDCDKCKVLTTFLNDNHYKYRILNTSKDHQVKEFMFDHLKTASYKGGIIDLPVIFFKEKKHWSIIDIHQFIKTYDWKLLERK